MYIQPVDTLDLVFKGLIIGACASAPMGPVGVLTVQRTISKGRWCGFATGVGAALSDLVYAMLTGLGMSFVMEYFEQNPHTMAATQAFGSVMLFLFGLHLYRTNPLNNVPQLSLGDKRGLFNNVVTGFLITFCNPLIMFLFVALFARFSFVVPEHYTEQAMGYLALFVGALGWWYWLSYFINKVRQKFNIKGIIYMNRTIGLVVMVVSLLGFYFTIRGKSLY